MSQMPKTLNMRWVFAKLSKRRKRPWWFAPIRFKCADCRYFFWPADGWCELYCQFYRSKFAALLLVVPAGQLLCSSPDERWKLHMSFFDKLPVPGVGGSGGALPSDDKFSRSYPAVWSFLTLDEYEPGSQRERSGLTLHVEQGVFKLFLSEKTKEAGIDATGTTFVGALAALEARLTSEAPGWRSTARKGRGKR